MKHADTRSSSPAMSGCVVRIQSTVCCVALTGNVTNSLLYPGSESVCDDPYSSDRASDPRLSSRDCGLKRDLIARGRSRTLDAFAGRERSSPFHPSLADPSRAVS